MHFLLSRLFTILIKICVLQATKEQLCVTPPPHQWVNGVPYVLKLYAYSGIDISKSIEINYTSRLYIYVMALECILV